MQEQIPGVRIAALDHLRALAITLVFLFHYRLFSHPDWIDTWGSFGWTGVDLFFVLSGYLIAEQVFRQVEQGRFFLREFFLKRAFRILPAYYVVLALYFLVPAFREWESLAPLWKYLTFTQNLGLDLRYHRTFSHAWSLCIEEQFYFLFPLSVLLLYYLKAGKKAWSVVLILFLAGFVFRIVSWHIYIVPAVDTDSFGLQWYKYIYYPTYNRLDGLLAGISIAGVISFYPHLRRLGHRYSNHLLVAGLLLLTAAYFLCEQAMSFAASVFGYPLIAIAFGCMVMSGVSTQSILNAFTSRLTSYIATLSYAIYLVHKAAISFTHEQFGRIGIDKNSVAMFMLSALVSIAGAMILHYSIERPFMFLRAMLTTGKSKK